MSRITEKLSKIFANQIPEFIRVGGSESIIYAIGSSTAGSNIITISNTVDIEVGDILENNENVYGLVEINGKNMDEQCIYYLGKNKKFEGGCNLCFYDESINILSTLDLDENNKKYKITKENKLYHLLTDKKSFYINDINFYDYNASIDLFLNKSKLLSMKYV